ncbi:MAG: hypothetical protein NTZ05_20060 [Chloroflexi bacterium]|nr:hypothetical protein [Chloroflexota bacterium]
MFVSVSLFHLRSGPQEDHTEEASRLLPFEAHRGYQSIFTPDQLAAENLYLTHYAPALSRLPGLRRHLVGRAFTPDGVPSRYSHIAAIFWADQAAWEGAMQPGASERIGIPAVGEWAAAVETFGGDLSEVDPTGDIAATGALTVRLYNLNPADPAAAERYYSEVFAPQVRRLPGVRRYLHGPVLSLRRNAPPRLGRLTLIECAGWEAMRASARPELPPGVSGPEQWTEAVETYATEFEDVAGQ